MEPDQASRICEGVGKQYKNQAVTLARAVLALQDKIEQQLPIFEKLPLAQTMTTTQGEKVLKQNPASVEFRATVRDYAFALEKLQDIIENNKDSGGNITSLDAFRKKVKLAK